MRRIRYIAAWAALIAAAAIPSPAILAATIPSPSATVLHTYRKSSAMEIINAIAVDADKVLTLLPDEYAFVPAAAVGIGAPDQAVVVLANFRGSDPQIDDDEPAAADQFTTDLAILVQQPERAALAGLDIPGANHVYTLAIYTNDAPYAASLQEADFPAVFVPGMVYDRQIDDLTGVGNLAVVVPADDSPFYSQNTAFGYAPAGAFNPILWHNGSQGTSALQFIIDHAELGDALSQIYTEPGSSLNELLTGGGLGPGPIDPETGFESVVAPSLNFRYRDGTFGRLILFVPEPSTLALAALGLLSLAVRVRRPVSKSNSISNDDEESRAEAQRRGEFGIKYLSLRPQRLCVSLFSIVVFAASARANIFQWEYIDPADPSQCKRQSTTLAPDGAGVDAAPGADLSGRNLTMAYLIGADLTGAYGYQTNLTDADLSRANLTNASLWSATLTGADFTGAEVRGVRFNGAGLTTNQLYFTASYQAQDLTGISLAHNDLSGWSFAGQNLTNAHFGGATLTGADFTDAEVRGALFGRSQYCDDYFSCSQFGTGITPTQLYSTANYEAADLSGFNFTGNNLAGANFAGQNLTNASFRTPSTIQNTVLFGADFSGADTRGARILFPADAVTTNLILPDGHINGLDLDGGGLLVVRDYELIDPDYPAFLIPITIDQHLAMAPGSTLRIVFEADAWDSTFSFAPGIPVALGGTLELTFADDVNPASQVGRTFDLFNWTGVTPIGAFAVSSPYAWDLTNLYTTGEVTLTAIPEPSTVALGALSAFSLTFNYRRKNT